MTTIQANEKPKTTFDRYMETLPVHIQWLLMQYKLVPGGEQTLKQCLANN
jgi:hypothetical protein